MIRGPVSHDQRGRGSRFPAKSPGANAFLEGWTLYAEGLAHELTLYSNAMQEKGRLGSLAFRAARLVVDPAAHHE